MGIRSQERDQNLHLDNLSNRVERTFEELMGSCKEGLQVSSYLTTSQIRVDKDLGRICSNLCPQPKVTE